MVDKDDLFQEEDSTDPQDHGGDEPSSDEDDEIIDLFDTVEIPADAIEEDIIELSDTVETSEEDILELTEEAQPSLVDDDVPDPAKAETENEADDFLDTIEMPEKNVEEDVIELANIAQETDPGALDITQELEPEADDEIIDLTEPVIEEVPEDEAIDLLDTIEMSGKKIEEDVIELADTAQEIDPEALDITQELEPEVGDETIDLTEPVIKDEPEDRASGFLDAIELPGKDIEKDVIELADTAEDIDPEALAITQELEPEAADEIIDLAEPVFEDELADFAQENDPEALDITQELEPEAADETIDLTDPVIEDKQEDETIDLLNTVEMSVDDMVDSPAAEEETLNEIFNPAETVAEDSTDQAVMDHMEPDESMEPIQEKRAAETATPPSVGYEEDKELLELIDDIQATLNDEPLASNVDDREDITEKDGTVDTGAHEEKDESYIFFEDDEFMDSKDIPQSETDFVDHLGIDLTSEIERKALEENREATMEDVKPAEAMEAVFGPGSLETAVKRALTEMLADENNPLTKAIENAVKKALGQGENTP